MTTDNTTPLIGADGEVREITADDVKRAKRGRPALPGSERKRRVNLMLDPDVIERLDATGNKSGAANELLRGALGL